ncbi:MAG: Stk1 family PASTA domain-containing Ser/Thr kinase [Tissierellaceae bacterium]
MIGKVLGGRYEIIEQIGGGGMALVYKAKCQLLDRFVAIKVLKDEYVNDEDFVRKFRRESQAAARLSHPNIVNIYDVGVENDNGHQIHYIVMEYIKGKTLKELIKEKGRLSVEDTLNFSYQIAEALQNAHQNHIFHRDIKPHNIMITEDKRIKVTDFGIARAATSSTVTTTSNVLGSVHYFSPEQARGGYTDDKSDIYSLGIVMYEMITGQLPYEGESPITVALKHVQEDIIPPREVEASVPIGLETIILKCVQKRQADRYSDIDKLLKDLRKIEMNRDEEIFDDIDQTDSHTRLIPTIKVEDEIDMKDKKNKKGRKKKDNTLKIVLLGILLAFLLAGSFFYGYFKLKDFLITEDILVPSIIGEQEEVAREIIEDLGLRFEVRNRVKDSNFAPGEVIFQSVDSGTAVKKDFPIEVTICEGENLVDVPDVVNRDLGYAREQILDSELKIEIEYEHSDEIPLDVVIRQKPDGGTSVEPGTRVTIVVSQGEDIKIIEMETLVGKNIEEAKRILKRLDLVEGEIRFEPNNEFAKDLVFWQSYEAGIELESKTAVDFYVSSGPVEEEEIEGDGEGEDDLDSPFTFTIPPFQDREETQIKIIRIQDGISKVVYNQGHKASDGDVTITLMGKIGALFDIYYDDIYQTTLTKKE